MLFVARFLRLDKLNATMRSHLISFLIGLFFTSLVSYFSYAYISRQNRNDYLKDDSRFFESLEVLQNRIDDLKMTIRPEKKSKANVGLIAIDDASIEEIGRWPWSRTILAEITEEVLSHGAKSLTYDILLSEPERENPNADQILGDVIHKYEDRLILGTASNGQYPAQTQPYQDICTAEAFLHLGGDRIVTLNPTFVVDDQSENFESSNWKELFDRIFLSITEDVEKQFLQNVKSLSIENLNTYQKNALNSQKSRAINGYCYSWLTPQDIFLQKSLFQNILPYYEAAFKTKLDQKSFIKITDQIKKTRVHPIPQYLGWYSNTPAIQNNSKMTASFNTKMDSDGFIRRYPLFYRAGSKMGSSYIPSLAMQTYLIAQNYRAEVILTESIQKNEKVLSSFKIFDNENDQEPVLLVPTDSFSQLRLNYYGPEKSFYYISAKELLTKKNQPTIEVQIRDHNRFKTEIVDKNEFFKNRSLLIGATALGIYDVRNTPLQNAMPGPEIHLTAIANLLEKNFILDLKNAATLVPALTFVLGVVLSLIWAWGSALSSLFIFVITLIIYTVGDYILYVKKSYMIQNWTFFAVIGLTYISVTIYKYFTEERNKNKVRKAFSKYVSPAVVEELLKSHKNLELGGSKKNLTVLFSDLRGFTTFSEKLEPKALADFLNLYLTKMTEEIYKTKGTVDKFIGDAIMTFFGAPVSFENHPHLACRCALQSVQKLAVLNHELKDQNFPRLEMGIGINTGEMSVGNMGSSTIQNYTVMGDSVNLASRLESLTRTYGNHIILGESTYQAVKNDFICRELDQVIVKGKTTTITIYDLLYEGKIKTEDQAWLSSYHQGREFYNLGSFNEALSFFNESLTLKPEDQVSQYYVKKCTQMQKEPVPENWTGVSRLKDK